MKLNLLAQREGFEPSCGVIHKLISSQPRYDRFDTSAYEKHIKFYGILIENCLLTSRKSSLQIPKKQGFSRVYMNRIGTKPSFFRVSPVMTASHIPPEDRQARLSDAGCGYIRHRRNTSYDAAIYIF